MDNKIAFKITNVENGKEYLIYANGLTKNIKELFGTQPVVFINCIPQLLLEAREEAINELNKKA